MKKGLFKVEIDDKRSYEFDLEEDLRMSEAEIDQHLMTQPSIYAKYATVFALARSKAERLEYELEAYEHKLDLDLREKAIKDEQKITEGQLKSLVKTDEGRLSIVRDLVQAKEQMDCVLAARESLAQRKDCLISLGANKRSQSDTELSISTKRR